MGYSLRQKRLDLCSSSNGRNLIDVRCCYCGAPTIEIYVPDYDYHYKGVWLDFEDRKTRLENRAKRMKQKYKLAIEDISKCVRTLEHIVPKSWGGSDNLSNLAISCKLCNQKRGAYYSHEEFKKYIQQQMIRGDHHSERVCKNVPYVVEEWKRQEEEEKKRSERIRRLEQLRESDKCFDVALKLSDHLKKQRRTSSNLSELGIWLTDNFKDCRAKEFFGIKGLSNYVESNEYLEFNEYNNVYTKNIEEVLERIFEEV